MKKIFNKFTKFLLLAVMIFSDLMTPVKVFAAEEETAKPQKGDVGINEVVSDDGQVVVTSGSLTNQGDVLVTKTVKKDGEGKFTVEFEVKGKDVENTTTVTKPVYAVVVLDTSGSMICDADNGSYAYDNSFFAGRDSRSYTAADGETIYCSNARYHSDYILTDKWENAVSGAVTFSENLADLDNTYVSVVTFASTATTATSFAHGALSESDFSHPVGGTNLEQGLSNAKSALDGITDANAQKYIVVIGDGEPTYYGSGIKDNDGYDNYPTATSNAKTAADNIKNNGINIFTIGYGIDNNTNAQNILKYVSSNTDENGVYTDNGYYQSANSSGIAGTLQTVFDQLSTSIAGTGATLTDNIGSSFSVDANSSNLITVTGSSVSNKDKFDITEKGTKISFDVEINGDEADGWVNVNEGFTLTYTDANGEEKTITYGADQPQPEVYWERNTYDYVINYYKEEVTNTSDSVHYLGTSGNLSAFNGEVITLTDAEKNAYLPTPGYELSDSNIYTITIDKTSNNNVIDVLYERIDLEYSVKYLFEGENGYAERSDVPSINNINVKYGDEVNAVEKKLATEDIPTGYVFDEAKTTKVNNGIYTITNNDTVVNVYYKKQELTYNVRYLFQDLNGEYVQLDDVHDLTNQPAKYGDEVSYTKHVLANAPTGYLLDTAMSANEENNNGIYVITNNDATIYVYYKRVNSNFTVNYFFNGTPFDEVYSYSSTAVYGSTLNAIDYKLETVNNAVLVEKENTDNEDYFIDPTDERNNASITAGTEDSMSLYYISTFFEEDAEEVTKSSTTEKVTASNQVIDYTITYENTIKNVREGDVITVTVTDTLPFEIDTNNENTNLVSDGVTGVYDNSNKTITWTFEETASEFTSEYIITKTISFTVVYKDFAQISAEKDNNLVNTASGVTTINNKSTDGDNSDTEEIPVEISGNLIVYHYEKGTTIEVAGHEEYTGLVGASYADKTNYKTDIIGYTYDSVTGDENGNYIEGTKEVIYYYTRKDGEIEKPTTTKTFVKEDGQTKNIVEGIDSTFKYTINAKATVKDFVGNVKVVATDYLPYEINIKESKLNGCNYDANNKTITCSKDFGEITKDNYTTTDDGEYVFEINESFDLELVYEGIKDKTVENSAKINVLLNEKEREDGESPIVTETVEVKEGTLEVVYKSKDEVFESTTTTKLAGTDYTTSEKSFFGYHLVEVKGNRKGKYLPNQTVTVEYIYELNEGEITNNKVTKEGPEIISDVNDYTEYVFTYDGTVKDYIGKATLTLTDVLPYEIYRASYDDRCDYDFDSNTFTCKVEYDITEEDYVNGKYNIHEEFYLNVVYGEIDSDVITNKVDSKLELRKVYKDSESSVDSKILKGELLVSYVDEEGNELDSYTITDHAGLYYETEEREFDGYTFKSSSDNTEGFLIANETVYVEYVYSKNVGTYEELPPFTGVEDISVNYIGYILAAFLFILLGKKKEVKNN